MNVVGMVKSRFGCDAKVAAQFWLSTAVIGHSIPAASKHPQQPLALNLDPQLP